MCSGRWPGVSIATMRTSPSSTVVPSPTAWLSKATSSAFGTWIVAPVASASRPRPETWSAWLCVSSTCRISNPFCSASARYSSISHFGSITAPTPPSATTYEAQPRSRCSTWRKNIYATVLRWSTGVAIVVGMVPPGVLS